MKARTRKTRWPLITLLFGLLAAAGLAFTRHHARTLVAANVAPAPTHVVLPKPHAVFLASTGGKHTLWAPAVALPDDGVTAQAYSNTRQPPQAHAGTPSNTSTATSADGSSAAAATAGTSGNGAQPGNRPATATGHQPQPGAGEMAYNGYVPLDCELPAGCGAQGTAIVSRQPSGTSGGMPGAHDSGSVSGDGSGNNDPPSNKQNEDPPSNTDPRVASAPELDPATLAGAVTLLLGALAVLRSRRRVRVTR